MQIATDAIDRLHTTAESHDRVMVVEVMGRHSGWIATYAGIAGGATVVLIPEQPFDIDEVCGRLARRHERGRYASIVVVAEGGDADARHARRRAADYDRFGHVRLGGIADVIAREIERAHRVRDPGRACSATCSAAARRRRTTGCCRTRYGVAAIDAVHDGALGPDGGVRAARDRAAPLTRRSADPHRSTSRCTSTSPGLLRLSHGRRRRGVTSGGVADGRAG